MTIPFIAMTRSGHNFVINNVLSWKKGFGFLNLETTHIPDAKNRIENLPVKTPYTMILVRDVFNWLSSYLKVILNEKRKEKRIYMVEKYIKIWHEITSEAFDETNVLSDKFVIVYDNFCTDESYRRQICEFIGGKYNNSELNKVPKNGGYSSFDSNRYQRKGSQMKTLERFNRFIETPYEELYFDILNRHKDCIRLHKKYFPKNEKLDAFIRRHDL